MSMFPGAGASVYYNEAGEPLGWDYPSYDDAPDPDDYYDSWDDESPYDGDVEGCIAAGAHGRDADQNSDGTWECQSCYEDCTDCMDDDDPDPIEDQFLDSYMEDRISGMYE